MEIKNPLIKALTTGTRGTAGERAETGTAGGQTTGRAQASTSDQVTLTAAARSLLEASRETSAPVDGARVAALREAIAEGSYQVDAGRVVERLFALERQL
ncbi:MAG: flagellar biosynthesis anti-sigma factor FlgM [Gammaproteobacteria bacterium]|nr:MAG: flagellar biosynthesis anti-sigma factor FlgM [Gammaproteobacteria bacterium]